MPQTPQPRRRTGRQSPTPTQAAAAPAPAAKAPARRTSAPAKAAAKTATAARKPQAGVDPLDLARTRVQIEYLDVRDITPYPYNPRDNEHAIPAVAESIKAFGFLVPVVVDGNNVLVAGHTRTEAAKLLGLDEVPAIRATNLTQDQINAFRLIDNKVAEQAKWDHDLLAGEIQKLSDLGLDFTSYGWTSEEIDCLSQVVASDCLDNVSAERAAATESATQASQRRAPTQARFVLGEIVFFTSAAQYRTWVDGLRQLMDYNETAIATELKRRLGIMD